MNNINVIITAVDICDSFLRVQSVRSDAEFVCYILECPMRHEYVHVGRSLSLAFKETDVTLINDLSCAASATTAMRVEITHIQNGVILSRVHISFDAQEMHVLMDTRRLMQLSFQKGDFVTALINASDIFIMWE